MKVRGSHIAMAIATLIGAFVLSAVLRPEPSREAESEKEFLNEVRGIAKSIPSGRGTGQLPPAGREALVSVIEVETSALEIGPLSNKAKSTAEIKVFNRGKTILHISQIKTTCACTEGNMDSPDIAPGGVGKLIVTIDPFRIFGFDSDKTLTLYTNDPKRSTVDISVKTTIEPEFSLEPASIEFGDLPKGAPAQADMILRQLADDPIAIEKIERIGDLALADLTFSERPKDQWARPDRPEFAIHASLCPDVVPGAHAQSFRIHVQCKRFPYYTSRVTATIDAAYQVTPEQLVLTGGVSRRPSAATIEADQPFELLDVRTEQGLLGVATRPGDKPNTFVIEPEMRGEASARDRVDAILFVVKTADTSFPNRLPVRVLAGVAANKATG